MTPDVFTLLVRPVYEQMVKRLIAQGNVMSAPVSSSAVTKTSTQIGVHIVPYSAREAKGWAKYLFGGDEMGTFDGATVVHFAKGHTTLVLLRDDSPLVTPALRQLCSSLGHTGFS